MNKLNNFSPQQWISWIASYGHAHAPKETPVNLNSKTDEKNTSLSVALMTEDSLNKEEAITLNCPEPLEISLKNVIKISSKIFTQHFEKMESGDLKKWQCAFQDFKQNKLYLLDPSSIKKLESIQQGLKDLLTDNARAVEGLNKYRSLKNSLKQMKSLTPRELSFFSVNSTSQFTQSVEDFFKMRQVEIAKIQQIKNNFNLLTADLSQYENSRIVAFQNKNYQTAFKGTITELTEEYQKLSHLVTLIEGHRQRSGSVVMQEELNQMKGVMGKISEKLPLYKKLEEFVVKFYEQKSNKRIQQQNIDGFTEFNIETNLVTYCLSYRENKLNFDLFLLYLEDCLTLMNLIDSLSDLTSELTSSNLGSHFTDQMESIISSYQQKIRNLNSDLNLIQAAGPKDLMHRDLELTIFEFRQINNFKIRWNELKEFLKEIDFTQLNEQSKEITELVVSFLQGGFNISTCKQAIKALIKIKLTPEEVANLVKKLKACEGSNIYKLDCCLNNFQNLIQSVDPALAKIDIWHQAAAFVKDSLQKCREMKTKMNLLPDFESNQAKLAYIINREQLIDVINKKATELTITFDEVINHINKIANYNLSLYEKQSLAEIYRNFIIGTYSLDQFNILVQEKNARFEIKHHKADLDSLILRLNAYKLNFGVAFSQALAKLELMSRKAEIPAADPEKSIAELTDVCHQVRDVVSWLEDNNMGSHTYKLENVVVQRLDNSINRDAFITEFRNILISNNIQTVDRKSLGKNRSKLQRLMEVDVVTIDFKALSKVYKQWCITNHPDKVGADKTLENEKTEISKKVNSLFSEIKRVCSDLPEDFRF